MMYSQPTGYAPSTCTHTGVRSALACGVLAKNGFQVTNLAGGFRGWRDANTPKA
jgi:rhodanese-related sulfurtransferase